MKIHIDEVIRLSGGFRECGKLVGRTGASVQTLKSGMDPAVLARGGIAQRFRSVQSRLADTEHLLQRIGDTLESGANTYRRADMRLRTMAHGEFREQKKPCHLPRR